MRRAKGYIDFCNTKIVIFLHICIYIGVKYTLYVLTYTLNIVNGFFKILWLALRASHLRNGWVIFCRLAP